METVKRNCVLIPLAKTRTVGVVINLSDRGCAAYVRYLKEEAARFGFEVEYLLVNHDPVEIPQWALRDEMTVINFKKDFDGACRFLTGTAAEFSLRERDYLIVLSETRSAVIDAIVQQAVAGFKVGRGDSGSDRLYDLTVRVGWRDRGENLAALLFSSLKVLTREIDQREDEGK